VFRHLLFPIVLASFCLPCTVVCSSSPRAAPPAAADEALRRYVPLLKDDNPLVRKRAALALKRLGTAAKSAIPALEEALSDKDADVRAAVAAALEAIDPTSRSATEKPPSRPVQTDNKSPAGNLLELKNPPASPETRKAPPSRERVEVGSYYLDPKSSPSTLVRRQEGPDGWRRLKPGARVFTNDRLVSLPGYASEVHLNSGVHLLLRGHVPQLSLFPEMDYLQDCAVVLHKGKALDADLTLERGRLFVSNHKDKGSATVRLRFEKQVWDLTLQPDAEVVLDLLRRNRSDIDYIHDEESLATLHLFVLHGKAGLAIGYQRYPDLSPPPGPAYFVWDNKGPGVQGPIKQDKVPPFFAKMLPVSNRAAEDMNLALKEISLRMPTDNPVAALDEVLQKSKQPMQHRLAIYCLGALDQVRKLIDILGDPAPLRALDRDTAIFTLRRWLGRGAAQGRLLFDGKKRSGILLDGPMYRFREAEILFVLLHDFTVEASVKPETYELLANYLLSDKVAIAELARWHLVRLPLSNKVAELLEFNAAASRADRERLANAVKRQIVSGRVPPAPPARSEAK
jgi:hypothetical protein